MTNYKNIFGKPVKFLATDPDNAEAEGQIWYNSTSDAFKSIVALEAWSSGAPLIETAANGGGAGTQATALFFGGRAGGSQRNTTQEYNGTGFSTSGAMNTGRAQMGAAGTQTAALAATGMIEPTPTDVGNVEEYNGSTWSEETNVSTNRYALGGTGIQTAAVIAGGRLGPGTWSAVTEEYDGTSWTNSGNLNQTKTLMAAMTGTQTAAVAFGGDGNPPTTALNDLTFYDGTSWTETGNLPAANRNAGSSGPQTSSILFGGLSPSETANSFLFDGTTFSATASMGSATYLMASAARASNNNTALSMGGYGGSAYVSRTEEYNFSTTVTTGAAWSSGGSMNTSRSYMAGLGTRPASLAAGGSTSSPGLNQTANSEEYDGTSWSEGNNLGTARVGLGGAGSQTSSIAAGGRTPSDVDAANSEEYNGTSWTATPSLSTGRRYVAGFGASETAAVVVGGTVGGAPGAGTKQTATEEYNGSSWTSGGAMNTAKTGTDGNSVGTETAGLYITGNAGVEEYNGTTWSEVNDLQRPAPGNGGGACGVQTSALFAGAAAYETKTEIYDGTSFKTTASLGTGRAYSGGSGASSATGTIFGGRNSPSSPRTTGATEEFNPETTALNLKTLTTS